jgi:predicted helicase
MSQLLISKYLNELAKLREVSGTNRESVVREAFKDLLKAWAQTRDLTFVAEYEIETKAKERRYVDGALLHTLRVPFGYWEAKDEKDDLDSEIESKFKRGYPRTNIIFDDSKKAVLIQHSTEVMRCDVDDTAQLEKLLKLYFGYERPEVEAFRKAVEQFQADLPTVLDALRAMIEAAHKVNHAFRSAAAAFLSHAKEAINPRLAEADVREMLIQHVLTGEVFSAVFPGNSYHEDNNIAVELHKLEATFFTGNTKHQTLKGLAPYYSAIRKAAAEISTHHEKQAFLKSIYENFYKVYNPKAADRLGVVYTPNEIVRFMIEGTDWLCQQHFDRRLVDKNVDILDPATGTGTFICELIEHFRGQPTKLKQKYLTELHANEVAILPYYVANLNIEATFAAATGNYEEFPGLCFVDTLDNTTALRKHRGHMDDLFGSVTDENIGRIKRQNVRTISVVIGNPPYNANQLNENQNNKNREYPEIDRRIRETYVDSSDAQKTKAYDMYVRFVRWSSDRLDENGVLAFVSNNSFFDKKTFDGFRKCLVEEFNEIRVIDLKGEARGSGDKRKRQGGNVFHNQIRVGIAVWFCVRRKGLKGCRIFYDSVRDFARAEEKLEFLKFKGLWERNWLELRPDKSNYWTAVDDNDFQSLVAVASKEAKSGGKNSKTIFRQYSLGVSTNRDEWLYDLSEETLQAKIKALAKGFEAHPPKSDAFSSSIKWSETLKRKARSKTREEVDIRRIRRAAYRPFFSMYLYQSSLYIDRPGALLKMFPGESENVAICFSDPGARTDYVALAVGGAADLHFGSSVDGYQQLPLYIYDEFGAPSANVTDWALNQFRKQYRPNCTKGNGQVTKESIFDYVYGVLNNPAYREKYASNLRREFPRIPFYSDFWQWAAWGRRLKDLHIGYEAVAPFVLDRVDKPDEAAREAGYSPKAILRGNRDARSVQLDSETTLLNIPEAAWEYRLGNRSALEWVLDQYKERAPKDPTILARFNTYHFADYKEAVIGLLQRVCTVSVETQKIITEMAGVEK